MNPTGYSLSEELIIALIVPKNMTTDFLQGFEAS